MTRAVDIPISATEVNASFPSPIAPTDCRSGIDYGTAKMPSVQMLSKHHSDAVRLVDEHLRPLLRRDPHIRFHFFSMPYDFAASVLPRWLRLTLALPYALLALITTYLSYDIVHYSSDSSYFWFFHPLLGRHIPHSPPAVLTVHHVEEPLPLGHRAARLASRLNSFNAVLASSAFTSRQLLSLGVASNLLHTVPLGVDDCFFPDPQSDFSPQRFILYVGDEYPRKNLPSFIAGLAPLLRNDPSLAFVKIGIAKSNEHKRATDQALATHGLPPSRVRLLRSHIDTACLRHFYSNALCLVAPSNVEGFCLPVVEAARCRCPVLLSGIDTFTAFKFPEHCYVSEYREPAAWTRAISWILSLTAEERNSLSEACAQVGGRYTWSHTAHQIVQIYLSLTTQHQER
jgi:glycosyltransferase involved in cell wall biosynthesis